MQESQSRKPDLPDRFDNDSVHMSTVLCFRAGRMNSPQEFRIKGFT